MGPGPSRAKERVPPSPGASTGGPRGRRVPHEQTDLAASAVGALGFVTKPKGIRSG